MTDITQALESKDVPDMATSLIAHILDENPMHKRFILASLQHIEVQELDHLERYLEFCAAQGLDIGYIAESYQTIVEDTFREQIYFMKHQTYRHKSYAEVAADVYHNDEYMNKYMYGLAISSFLWPNHLDMARHFKRTLPTDRSGKYLEIGPGHGYYLMNAVEMGAYDHYLGIDISDTSIRQTRAIIEYFAPQLSDGFQLQQADFLDASELETDSFDAIVMGEVLEHVEQPDIFVQRIAELAREDAHIFITTCVNAPALDHIYLWRSTQELEQMIESNGLRITDALRLPYEGKTLEESLEKELAINVSYVLEKS